MMTLSRSVIKSEMLLFGLLMLTSLVSVHLLTMLFVPQGFETPAVYWLYLSEATFVGLSIKVWVKP